MALTVSNVTTANSTTSSATLVTGSNVTASIGDWLFVAVAADNNGTSGAASLSTSMSDSAGNTYTNRGGIINNDPGAAAAGVSLGIWTCQVTNAITNGTITANFSPNTASKAMLVKKISPGVGETIFFGSVGSGATSTTTSQTITATSVTSGYTVIGAVALEDNVAPTADSDTTNGSWSTQYSATANGGSVTTSATVASQQKTVSATGNQTYNTNASGDRDTAINYVVLYVAAAQTLQPPLLDDSSDTFYAATISSLIALSPALYDDSTDTFYSPSVAPGAVSLQPALLDDSADTFYAPTVAGIGGSQGVSPALYDDSTDTFYSPSVAPGAVSLQPAMLDDSADTFYAPTISAGAVSLSPSIHDDSADTFYSATVTPGDVALSPALFDGSATVFYSPAIIPGGVYLVPELFNDGDLFFQPAVSAGAVSLQTDLFDDSNDIIYSAQIGLAGNSQNLTAALIDDQADEFYVPTVFSRYTLAPSFLDEINQFYSADLSVGAIAVYPQVVDDSVDVFYSPLVQLPGSAQALLAGFFDDSADYFYPHGCLQSQLLTAQNRIFMCAAPRRSALENARDRVFIVEA